MPEVVTRILPKWCRARSFTTVADFDAGWLTVAGRLAAAGAADAADAATRPAATSAVPASPAASTSRRAMNVVMENIGRPPCAQLRRKHPGTQTPGPEGRTAGRPVRFT